MQIKDLCAQLGLTKKAVDYYEKQGLVHPRVLENGYRDYRPEDVDRLAEISLLRKLGLGVTEIRSLLDGGDKTAILSGHLHSAQLRLQKSAAQLRGVELLIRQYDRCSAEAYVRTHLENGFTIREKLLQAFPGPYGAYLDVHFGRYLNEAIETPLQQQAYREIIAYLDEAPQYSFSQEAEQVLQDSLSQLSREQMEQMDRSFEQSIDHMDSFLEENRSWLEEYIQLRNSEEFRKTPYWELYHSLMEFQKASGYQERFLDNIKKLSSSYREYCLRLERANQVFLQRYPQASADACDHKPQILD